MSKRKDIIGAVEYSPTDQNSVYMGGLATSVVFDMLGGNYGQNHGRAFRRLVMDAPKNRIRRAHEYITRQGYLAAWKQSKKCPTCGHVS